MSDLRNHHGYSVNVKDHTHYGPFDLPDADVERVYEQTTEQFWEDAKFIATEHGFKGVWSEGRSGGYVQPYPQPATDDMYEFQVTEWEQDTFVPFKLAIERLLLDYRQYFAEAIEEALGDRETRRELCLVRGEN